MKICTVWMALPPLASWEFIFENEEKKYTHTHKKQNRFNLNVPNIVIHNANMVKMLFACGAFFIYLFFDLIIYQRVNIQFFFILKAFDLWYANKSNAFTDTHANVWFAIIKGVISVDFVSSRFRWTIRKQINQI